MDVVIYKRVDGMPIELVIALTQEAQDGTHKQAVDSAERVDAVITEESKRRSGDSKVVVERLAGVDHGATDWFVILDDTAGEGAEGQIEWGRYGQPGKLGLTRVFDLGRGS